MTEKSVGRPAGVEPETVTLWRWTRRDGHGWMRHRLDLPGPWESQEFVPLSALRLVEEELARVRVLVHDHIDANGRLRKEGNALREERDGARLAGQEAVAALVERTAQRNNAEADRDRLAGALREIADQDWVENVLDPQWAARIAEAALSPVQGEHHAQPEGESQMDDNNLNHLIGERDAMKWVDGFLTVVPDADRDLMHTWFACAIESGRMTIQGEHEQDGDRCIVCGGKGRRSSWVNELGREVEGECRDCDGTGKAQDGEEIRRRAIHIIYSGEYDDLTGEQAKALAESDTPLIGYAQDGDTEETT